MLYRTETVEAIIQWAQSDTTSVSHITCASGMGFDFREVIHVKSVCSVYNRDALVTIPANCLRFKVLSFLPLVDELKRLLK